MQVSDLELVGWRFASTHGRPVNQLLLNRQPSQANAAFETVYESYERYDNQIRRHPQLYQSGPVPLC